MRLDSVSNLYCVSAQLFNGFWATLCGYLDFINVLHFFVKEYGNEINFSLNSRG